MFWYALRKNGCLPGSPSISTTDENFEAMEKMVLNNRQITIREVVDDIDVSFGSFQAMFTDVLDRKRATTKIVPKLLKFEINNVALASLRRC